MRITVRIAALIALAIGVAAIAASATDAPWQDWKVLRMKASSIPFFSGRLEMQIFDAPGSRRFKTHSTAHFFGARIANSHTVTVIDPETGLTRSYRSWSRKRGRRYTFGESSYVLEKLLPVKEAGASTARWSVRSREEFAYPKDGDGGTIAVFDYYGMLLHLRRTNLHEVGDEVVLYVATSKGPQPYRIMVSEVRSSTHSVTDLRIEKTRSLPARELRLRIIPADPERADEGFLKMEGETELWVEAKSKTPLLLSGKAPKIPGRIRLELFEID
jgi:hypothetical protein